MLRASGILKLVALIGVFLLVVFLAFQLLDINEFNLFSVMSRSLPANVNPTNPLKHKCGLTKDCPSGHLAFKMTSGAASVVGPRICLDDKLSEVKSSLNG